MMNKGLNRPIDLKAGKEYDLKVIVDDNILTIYLDGTALNARVYHKFGHTLSVTVTNGTLQLEQIEFSNDYRK